MIVNNDEEMKEAVSQFKGLVKEMKFNVEYPMSMDNVIIEIQGETLIVSEVDKQYT